MVNEGEEIEAEREGRAPVVYTREELGRKAGAAIIGIVNQLHMEFYNCFFTGNRPEKVQKEIQRNRIRRFQRSQTRLHLDGFYRNADWIYRKRSLTDVLWNMV